MGRDTIQRKGAMVIPGNGSSRAFICVHQPGMSKPCENSFKTIAHLRLSVFAFKFHRMVTAKDIFVGWVLQTCRDDGAKTAVIHAIQLYEKSWQTPGNGDNRTVGDNHS